LARHCKRAAQIRLPVFIAMGNAIRVQMIWVQLTDEFLKHQASIGNDLITPRQEYGFPGLKAGDHWCVCIERWKESYDAGIIGAARLEATHEKALEVVSMEMLLRSASLKSTRAN
jgi:hypothetical protein